MSFIHLSKSAKAEGVLGFITLLWGLTFVLTKTGLNDASPFIFLTLRFSLAFVIYVIIFRKHFKRLGRRTIRRAMVLSLFFFSGYALQTLGLKYTTVAKSALFTYIFAIFVPPLQFFLTRKRPKIVNIAALAVVFIGMIIFTAPGNSSLNIGDLFTVIGAVGYALFIIYVDKLNGKEDPVVLTGFQFLTSAVIAAIMSVFLEDAYINITSGLIISILYLVIPGSIIAILLMNKYQGMTTPVRACIIYALEPVFSILFGWLILSEGLSPSEMLGSVLIISGVVFAEVLSQFKSS